MRSYSWATQKMLLFGIAEISRMCPQCVSFALERGFDTIFNFLLSLARSAAHHGLLLRHDRLSARPYALTMLLEQLVDLVDDRQLVQSVVDLWRSLWQASVCLRGDLTCFGCSAGLIILRDLIHVQVEPGARLHDIY